MFFNPSSLLNRCVPTLSRLFTAPGLASFPADSYLPLLNFTERHDAGDCFILRFDGSQYKVVYCSDKLDDSRLSEVFLKSLTRGHHQTLFVDYRICEFEADLPIVTGKTNLLSGPVVFQVLPWRCYDELAEYFLVIASPLESSLTPYMLEWFTKQNQVCSSDRTLRQFGLSAHETEIPLSAMLGHVYVKDRSRVQTGLLDAYASGSSIKMNFRIVIPGGYRRWILGKGSPVVDDQNRIERYVLNFFDITQQKMAEQYRDTEPLIDFMAMV